MGITQIDVEQAAEKIAASGDKPTIEKVRLHLGMGSNTTISKYLNDWRLKQEVLQDLPPSSLPPDPVNAAVQQVWQQMQEKAQAEIKIIQEKTQQEITAMRDELQLAIEARNHLSQQISELEKRNNLLLADKELLILDLKASEEEKEIVKVKYAELQKQYEVLSKHSDSRIEELKHELLLITQNHQQHITDLKITNENAIHAFSAMHESERQKQIVLIDELKIKEKNHIKQIEKSGNDIEKLKIELAEVNSLLNNSLKENERIMSETNNKNEIIAALSQWNNFEAKITRIHSYIETYFEKLLAEQANLSIDLQAKLQQIITEINQLNLIAVE